MRIRFEGLFVVVIVLAFMCTGVFAEKLEQPWTVYGVDAPMTRLMSAYYNIPQVKVVAVGQNMHYTNDVPVCLFLSQVTDVDVFRIERWRIEAKSWMDIMKKLKFGMNRLFTPVNGSVPSAFSHAYKEYSRWKSNNSYEMKIYDWEVRNLVMLKFMVSKFNMSPAVVMEKVSGGKTFTAMIMEQLEPDDEKGSKE